MSYCIHGTYPRTILTGDVRAFCSAKVLFAVTRLAGLLDAGYRDYQRAWSALFPAV